MRVEKNSTQVYAILDAAFGSTGKGLLAGYLAETRQPTAAISAWGPNSGHSYITAAGVKLVHTMLPFGVISPRCHSVFIGPGSVLDLDALQREWSYVSQNVRSLEDVTVYVHENAAYLSSDDKKYERSLGLAKIGSTLKGTIGATIRKLHRKNDGTVKNSQYCLPKFCKRVSSLEWTPTIKEHGYIIQIEGAQGFSLSLNHGFYPYVTSRDCTPQQLFVDTGIGLDTARRCHVYQSMRTYPIRVNNREGTSGPGYPDQPELSWTDLGVEPELTTVTKLPRRIFTWSRMQLEHMDSVCGHPDGVFLNFVNYVQDPKVLLGILRDIYTVCGERSLRWIGLGPTSEDVYDMHRFEDRAEACERSFALRSALDSTFGKQLLERIS